MVANLVAVLAGLRAGNIRGWLNEGTLRAIERARPGLGGRVSDEFARAAPKADDSPADWRVQTLPLLHAGTIEPIRLYHRPAPEDEPNGDDAGTRFVLEARLQRQGRLQLDGLLRRPARQFDLFVRTERPLPANQRNDIRILFAEALALTGYRGRIAFQAAPPNFVEPTPAAVAATLEMDA